MQNISELKIGVIIPVYNEAVGLSGNFDTIDRALKADGIAAHYMLVDDGSSDATWQVIQAIAARHSTVGALRFAKNFGKEMALSAGVDALDADIYVTLDSDLQHPPEHVKTMLDLMRQQAVDIVSGIKADRGDESALHRLIAKSYYRFLGLLTHLDMQNSSDFKVFNRRVADALRGFHERQIFFRGIVDWVGFAHLTAPFKVAERKAGSSRFSTLKLTKLALTAIISYTSKPLYLVAFSGFIFAIFAVLMGIQTIYNYFSGQALDGFSTVILILLITGALMMISLGVIGIYISRIYEEIKARPRYIVRQKI